MKFTLSFKTPDVLNQLELRSGISGEDLEEAKALARKFLEYSEYIRVEFDTRTQTAVVKEHTR
jgi:hypothetical protein